MRRRHLTTLAAAALAASLLPGATVAHDDEEIDLTFALNPTCEFGQGSDMAPCEADEDGVPLAITFANPQHASGVLEGMAVLTGTFLPDYANGTFKAHGTAFFAGEAHDCGEGTLHLDYAGSGTINEDGTNTSESDVYTVMPGGTLPVTGSYEQTVAEVPNDDGTATATYTASLTCEAT